MNKIDRPLVQIASSSRRANEAGGDVGRSPPPHTLEQPHARELVQVTTHRVLGNTKARHQFGDDDTVITVEPRKDRLPTLSGQHLHLLA